VFGNGGVVKDDIAMDEIVGLEGISWQSAISRQLAIYACGNGCVTKFLCYCSRGWWIAVGGCSFRLASQSCKKHIRVDSIERKADSMGRVDYSIE
jgi:hypothetical protein